MSEKTASDVKAPAAIVEKSMEKSRKESVVKEKSKIEESNQAPSEPPPEEPVIEQPLPEPVFEIVLNKDQLEELEERESKENVLNYQLDKSQFQIDD